MDLHWAGSNYYLVLEIDFGSSKDQVVTAPIIEQLVMKGTSTTLL